MEFRKLSSGEMIKLANDLTSEIEKVKKITKEEFIQKGYLKENERLSYENIDLGHIEKDLMLLLYSYHKHGNVVCNRIKVEKVCFAALCQFIKSEYHVRAYTKDYEALTGIKVNSKFYNILENGFKQEGILPENWDKMKGFRYKDTLINETGIPKYLANDILEVFKVYWKNLRQFEFDYIFENMNSLRLKNYIWDTKEVEILKESYENLTDYPRKVKTVIRRLTEVCTLLEEGNYYEEDLEKEEVIRGINKVLKFDIFRILPRKESLKLLYIQILSKVSVNKFKNIVDNMPSNTSMRMPSGSNKSRTKLRDIQLGIYNINSPIYRMYTVLPHTSLSMKSLLEFKYNQFIKIKEENLGYRSTRPYKVKLGKYKEEESYPLYDDRNRIQGYYWYGKIPSGMPVIINNHKYEPEEFVNYAPIFKYSYNDYGNYNYNLVLNNFKMYLPAYSEKNIAIHCNYSDEVKYLNIDNEGYVENKQLVFNINKAITDAPVTIQINNIDNEIQDILYKKSIKRVDDINLYVKNLRKNNYYNTNFEYNLNKKDWTFNNQIIFHIEQVGNKTTKVISNIKNIKNEVEVLVNHDNKYYQFPLEEISIDKGKDLFICNDKLRRKIRLEDNKSAKINLKFLYKYDKIFETDLILIEDIKIELDSKIYVNGEIANIKIKYKDKSYTEKHKIEIFIKNKLFVSKLVPISIYIDELDTYYTQYIKPNIFGLLVVDKENNEIVEIDSIKFEDIHKYEIRICTSLDDKCEVLINGNKITNDLENSNTINLSDYEKLFDKTQNTVCISHYEKNINITVVKERTLGIFNNLKNDLKWYEIDEIYTKEQLSEDIRILGEIFKQV